MKLNKQQNKAATYDGEAQNILVTAGAGCGKTRTIIARAIHLVWSGTSPSRILMMTFTNRAAREMKSRIESELGSESKRIQVGTFHSICLKVMSKLPKSFGITGLNIIDADDQQSLMTLVRKVHISKDKRKLKNDFPKPLELLNYYSYSRNTCQSPKKYLLANTDLNKDFVEMCVNIFNEYQQAKKLRGYLDYDDLLESLFHCIN